MKFLFKRYPGRLAFVREELGSAPVTLLDVGNLGDGESTCAILKADVERNGGTYYGLDSNEPLTRKLNLPNQELGDLHATEFDDDMFDAIYAGEIIEHTWTPAVMIRECRRILKPGGKLILDTPNPYSILNMLRFLLRSEDSMGDNRLLTYHEAMNGFEDMKSKGEFLLQPQHKIFFTPAMLKQLAETQGLILESIGCTFKPRTIIHRLLLMLFPQSGPHLCAVLRKATVEEAFADMKGK
jgi:2-polyprenyl-3-methyl-5-hydroxy-6-metoxy-1,4-benzoquinol methylase